jgi:hypothetical protein
MTSWQPSIVSSEWLSPAAGEQNELLIRVDRQPTMIKVLTRIANVAGELRYFGLSKCRCRTRLGGCTRSRGPRIEVHLLISAKATGKRPSTHGVSAIRRTVPRKTTLHLRGLSYQVMRGASTIRTAALRHARGGAEMLGCTDRANFLGPASRHLSTCRCTLIVRGTGGGS